MRRAFKPISENLLSYIMSIQIIIESKKKIQYQRKLFVISEFQQRQNKHV